MNEPKFTKGEWLLPHFVTAKDETDCTCRFVLNEKYCGCIATIEYGEIDNPPLEEAKANAFLTCAAPDMFHALKSFVDNVDEWLKTGEPANPETSKAIYDEAKMALMKALGEANQ